MKKKLNLLALLLIVFAANVLAQYKKTDTLKILLIAEKQDSNKVNLLWQLAKEYQDNKPDTALLLAQEALQLARRIKYIEGESKALALLAASQYYMGNYPKALENYLLKLQIEEKRKVPKDYSVALNNIGLMYVLIGEYDNAIVYLHKSDSVETLYNINYIKHSVMLNLGEAYFRKNNLDSSFTYFNKSLELAKASGTSDEVAMSEVGVGNALAKQNNNTTALQFYLAAIQKLKTSTNEDLFCEAALGIGKVYNALNKKDSAMYYARQSYMIGKKDGFISRQLDASQYLVELFRQANKPDSALLYLQNSIALKDSVMGQDKIRQSQIISSSEQLRQHQIEEDKKIAKKERKKQLQLLFIGIFIPIFFLFTLYISHRKINPRVIKFLGIISLLLLFEYLTLFLHPFVVELTNHTPILELLIFVTIASFLIPLHHRLEGWLIKKLTSARKPSFTGMFTVTTKKIKAKK
ncbi:MAG: tetratricopeptide repeat protein [Ferruginibacter sp.]|nr:tetratricopeptide repeat protein [Ferruginibacter sp.]